MTNYKIFITLCAIVFSIAGFSQTGWITVSNFGTNPGNLNMYCYVPDNMPSNAPLVVVMHGCTENAAGFSSETAWNTLADYHKFYVVYAEQNAINNSSSCFNWFQLSDISRGQGESLSVKQMVDNMKNHYNIDSSRVFVTGLSAGAAFTAVMMAAYPEIFAAGAIMAGAPYKAATDATTALYAMDGLVTKTPVQWGDLVRNENAFYTGNYPKVAIFQGTSDYTVYPVNARELMKQWTNVHQTDTIPDTVISDFNGNNLIKLSQYKDTEGNVVVQTYMISNMMHGIAVNPGNCFQQGGTVGAYSYDENFYSSFWAAEFFGIINFPYQITGPISVLINQSNIIFSVPATAGSTYQWEVPSDASIVSGQGTHQITVNWGTTSGYVSVNETNSSSCIIGPVELYVQDTLNTSDSENSSEKPAISVFSDNNFSTLSIHSSLQSYRLFIFDITGKLIFSADNQTGCTLINLPHNMPAGVYMTRIVSGNKIYNQKFLKIPTQSNE